MYFVLFYDYVENVVERRAPYREAHLALVEVHVDRGELVLGGAFANPGMALLLCSSWRTK